MHLTSKDKVFLEWGNQIAPLIDKTGVPCCHHYIVFRGFYGDGRDAGAIGTTFAEMYLDESVESSTAYHYIVVAAEDEGEFFLTKIVEFSVTTKHASVVGSFQPTTPVGLAALGKSKAIKWTWSASQQAGSAPMLGYLIEDGVDLPQPRGFIWDQGGTQEWLEPVSSGQRQYRLRGIDWDLNVTDPSEFVVGKAGGAVNLIRDPQFGFGYIPPYFYEEYSYYSNQVYSGVYYPEYTPSHDDPSSNSFEKRIWYAHVGNMHSWNYPYDSPVWDEYWPDEFRAENEEPRSIAIVTECPFGLPENCSNAIHYQIPDWPSEIYESRLVS
jgi:hypothetical protein